MDSNLNDQIFNLIDKSQNILLLTHAKADCDGLVRALITPAGENAGFMLRSDSGTWDRQTMTNARMRLQSLGMAKNEAESILGMAVGKRWILVNVPFQLEFLGGRRWNLNAAAALAVSRASPVATAASSLSYAASRARWCFAAARWCCQPTCRCPTIPTPQASGKRRTRRTACPRDSPWPARTA